MKNLKRLVGGVLLSFSLVVGLVPVTDVQAADATYTESEDNNSSQNANAVTVNSGKMVISGVLDGDDDYDWYKLTFAEQGKCDFKITDITNPTESTNLSKYYFDMYNSEFEETDSYKYGLAHDADDVYYIRVKSNYFAKNDTYQITLTEDNSVEYVSGSHTSTSSAYLLTKGVAAFSLGWNDSNTRYFAITVPAGKKAIVYLEPDADADMNEIVSSPFQITLIRKSDNSRLLNNYKIKTETNINYITSGSNKIYLSGKDTYYIGINGGYYTPNCQWISVKYTLSDYKIDTKKPTITGVKNGKTYKKAVTIKFSDASGIKSAKLNGKKVKSGVKVKKNGSYTISVTDKAGNTKSIKFKIKIKKK